MKSWILAALAALIVSALVTLTVFEYLAVRDRQSISEITSDIRASVPQGSSTDDITRYLEARDIPYVSDSVSQQSNDTYRTLGIKAGTNVIAAEEYQEGTLLWLSPRDLQIVFVLDAALTLERIDIVAYNVE